MGIPPACYHSIFWSYKQFYLLSLKLLPETGSTFAFKSNKVILRYFQREVTISEVCTNSSSFKFWIRQQFFTFYLLKTKPAWSGRVNKSLCLWWGTCGDIGVRANLQESVYTGSQAKAKKKHIQISDFFNNYFFADSETPLEKCLFVLRVSFRKCTWFPSSCL